jgi:putative nicotinate phosphoribosyltransferase
MATNGSTALLTDRYELTMLDAAIRSGVAERRAVFEVFTRALPPGRRYGVFAGLGRLVEAIEEFRFGPDEIGFLESEEIVSERTLEWLEDCGLGPTIDAYCEGECYFPGSPVLTVEATFGEAVLLETLILSITNFDSAIAAAASRMVGAAAGRPIIEMGARRTNERAAVGAARAAYLAGFASTSVLEAGRTYGIPTAGTAAHAFVLAHDDERAAFEAQLAAMGLGTTFLVDTFDTRQGIKTAVELARKRGATGPGSIRLDSGDLVQEARAARVLLDELGATETGIVVTGDLDEYAIEALAGSPADAYGVGTRLVTGSGAPTAGLVYKLVAIGSDPGSDRLRPVEKRSPFKHSLGARKRAFRWIDEEGTARVEFILPAGTEPEDAGLPAGWQARELQHRVMTAGRKEELASLLDAREHHRWAVRELGPVAFDLRPGTPIIPTRYGGSGYSDLDGEAALEDSRPGRHASPSASGGRSALIVVDVQRDFCEGGALAVDGGDEVAERIAEMLSRDRAKYAAVVASRDWHVNPGRHFAPSGEPPDFVTTWPVHCVAGSQGAELHPLLATAKFDAVFDKGEQNAAYSAFEGHDEDGTPLASWLADRGIEEVVVCGLATDYCVRATVLDARQQGYAVRLPLPYTAGVAAGTTEQAISMMAEAGAELEGSELAGAVLSAPLQASGADEQ